jgi:CRP/FNR family transcriptional regulator
MENKQESVGLPSVFAGIGSALIQDLLDHHIEKKYQPGEIIVNQGEFWPYFFWVREGEISVIKESSEGRMLIASTISEGEIFWGITFFQESVPSPVILQVNHEAILDLWSRDVLLPLLKQNAALSWNLTQVMVARMMKASEIVEDLAFQPVMARLAGLVLDTFGDAEDEYVARTLTLDDMAARIGTTREMVCRHLYKFAEKGAIEIRRTEMKIVDKGFLEERAGKMK